MPNSKLPRIKTGIYYHPITLLIVEIFEYEHVDMCQLRTEHTMYYPTKAETNQLMYAYKFLGEL